MSKQARSALGRSQKLWRRRRALFVLLVFSACRSISDKGSDGPGGVETDRGGLAASTTLAQAVTGRIVAVPGVAAGGQIASSNAGAIGVDDGGGASYEVPIWAPDGVNGVRPSISLAYSSSSDSSPGGGPLGPKWTLKGLSVITRCAQNLARDGIKRPVNFTGDTFCLDGALLMRMTGSAGGTGQFQTEVNPFQKIMATQSDGKVILSFQVFQPDGQIYFYGSSSNSRLSVNDPSGDFFYSYHLDKIEDRYGNSILFTYRQDACCSATNQAQELSPASIVWGATGDTQGLRSIQFSYQPLSTYQPSLYWRSVSGHQINSGERISGLQIYGPDQTGAPVLLKQYNLGYLTPSITGQRLLSSITECDAFNVCKRPTKIVWEPGSLAYTKLSQGITDIALANLPASTAQGHSFSQSNLYRRILTADLNNDGLDDIIYRQLVKVTTGTTTTTNLGWVVRYNTSASRTSISFGSPVALAGATLIDPLPGKIYPYTGDSFFADVNGDGYPDMFVPNADNGNVGAFYPWSGNVRFRGYTAFATTGPTTSNLTTLDDSTIVDTTSPWISIGDVTGNGFPEVIRPRKDKGLHWLPVGLPSRQNSWFPPISGDVATINTPIAGFQLFDVDGDGLAEIGRDLPLTNGNPSTVITSPTINETVMNFPPINPQTPPQFARWVLDMNGDGIPDVAWVQAGKPNVVEGVLGTGTAFGIFPVLTTLSSGNAVGQSWLDNYENGVRVVDFNQDGREDLMLVDNGATPTGATRTNVVVLISNGDGSFTPTSTSIPIGQAADGSESVNPGDCIWSGKQGVCKMTPASHGYRTTTVADVNGDGLPDLLQLEGNPLSLQVYLRQGNKPDMVTSIDEGTGRVVAMTYAPVTDHSMYTPDLNACSPSADSLRRIACVVRGRWLTKQITESGLESPGVSLSNTTSYTYKGGLADRFGRGFLGFESRTVQSSNSKRVTITYNPNLITSFISTDPTYIFPYAFKPQTITTDTDTPQGPNAHHQRVEKLTYQTYSFGSPLALSKYTTFLTQRSVNEYDCPGNGAGGCATGSTLRTLSSQAETFTPTAYGAQTNHTTSHYTAAGALLETDVEATTIQAPDLTNWLVRVPTQVQETSTSPTETVTRTRNLTPDMTVNSITGLAIGVNQSVEYEPTGDASTHRLMTYGRDARGRVTSISDATSFVPLPMCASSCNASCNATCSHQCGTDASCISACATSCVNGCLPTCPLTPQSVRKTTIQFLDADGVYPSTVTSPPTANNLQGQTSRTWRHPGLGLIVESDDPNGLPTVLTYDTFGRPQSALAPTGASATFAYADGTDPLAAGGINMTVEPEGSATRQISLHLDSFGRETNRVTPIDAAQSMAIQTVYDRFGRVGQKAVLSGSPTAQTTPVNTFTYTYDDLDRQITDCHIAGDLANHCTSNSYDGLQVTSTDESGRATTRIADEMGRVTRVQARSIPDATFGYGPFSLLENESVADFSGQTDRVYDVLGRVTSVTRLNAGARITAYNAYGEVVQTAKAAPFTTAPLSDVLTYGRDALGRLTTLTGTGINRTLTWDKNADGTSGTNTIGKLTDTLDSGVNHEHFTYDSAGRLFTESWTLSLFGQSAQNFSQATYFYDSQGRLKDQLFPGNLSGSYVPLHLVYTYDPYMGKVASIADNVDLADPLWSASQRNAIGQIAVEALRSGSGVAMSRTNNFNLANGQLASAMLTGPTQSESLTYAYQPDGLPSSFGMNGVGGFWAASFDYDALKRLTTWVPSPGITLSYAYDGDGNITARNWGTTSFPGGLLTYSWTGNPGGRSLVVSGPDASGVYNEEYQMDLWGRIFDTPAASLSYNAADELSGVVEKTNGSRSDVIIRDGLGNRVATTYGSLSGPYSYLLTLMNGAYEFKYSSATNTTEERYRYFADGKLVGDVVRLAANQSKTSTFYLTDNVGSVVAEASDAGAVTARARRDPYGNLLADPLNPDLPIDPVGPDPDGSSRLGFGGHDREPNWGLVDASARFYSPTLGIFTTPDALMGTSLDRRTYNPIAYCNDNPVAMFDTNGHTPQAVPVMVFTVNSGSGGTTGSGGGGGGNMGSTRTDSSGGTSGSQSGGADGYARDPGAGGIGGVLNGGGSPGNGQAETVTQSPSNNGVHGTSGADHGDSACTTCGGTVSPMSAYAMAAFIAGLATGMSEAVAISWAMDATKGIQNGGPGGWAGVGVVVIDILTHGTVEALDNAVKALWASILYIFGDYADELSNKQAEEAKRAAEESHGPNQSAIDSAHGAIEGANRQKNREQQQTHDVNDYQFDPGDSNDNAGDGSGFEPEAVPSGDDVSGGSPSDLSPSGG